MTHTSPHWSADMLDPPLREAAATAFAMAGLTPGDMAGAQIYDCYTIAVLMALEAAGFCAPGQGMDLLRSCDLSFAGDLPLNTNGGQLGFADHVAVLDHRGGDHGLGLELGEEGLFGGG